MSTTNKAQHDTTDVDLGDLLDAGDGAVVTLQAGETRLVAHKAVLAARSPVFAAMFSHDTMEASTGTVTIPDVEGAVLRQLLAYCYRLRAPQLPGVAPGLLQAADKYGLSELKDACERQLVAQLAVDTAAASAVLAVRHSCPGLTTAAVSFIKAHIFQVLATQGWTDAMRNQPEDVAEVNRLLADLSSAAPAGGRACPSSDRGPAPPHTEAPPTPTPEDDAVSRMRSLSGEERGRRLIQAAKEGTAEELQALLTAGADVGATDGNRWTALHWAAHRGHTQLVRCLLRGGADVGPRDKEDRTALHLAALKGDVEAVRCLVEGQSDVEARSCRQNTPLHKAAWGGHTGVVSVLLSSSAELDARNQWGSTPLHLAVRMGHSEVAAQLLRAGANKLATDNSGKTPLDYARENNSQQLIDMLT